MSSELLYPSPRLDQGQFALPSPLSPASSRKRDRNSIDLEMTNDVSSPVKRPRSLILQKQSNVGRAIYTVTVTTIEQPASDNAFDSPMDVEGALQSVSIAGTFESAQAANMSAFQLVPGLTDRVYHNTCTFAYQGEKNDCVAITIKNQRHYQLQQVFIKVKSLRLT